jgi:flagellar hook-associated protein 3 FlgL
MSGTYPSRTAQTELGGVSVAPTDRSVQASEGVTYQQVQTAQTSATTSLKTQLSSIEDVDTAQMAIDVTTANTAYQAALQTSATVRQLSLLDFLR